MAVYDVSHYQSLAQVQHALATDAEAIFVKATEGAGYVDPEHAVDVAAIRHAGRRVGHYHFASHVGQPSIEATHFLAAAQPKPGDLLALDLEAMDGSWAQRAAYAATFIVGVDRITSARVFWYVNTSWRSALLGNASVAQRTILLSHPLWVATAGLPAGHPGVPGWHLHQYSTAGGIDHDVKAPGVNLAAYAIPLPRPPEPPPAPKPPIPEEEDVLPPILTTNGGKTYLVAPYLTSRVEIPDEATQQFLVSRGAVESNLSDAQVALIPTVSP